MYNMYNMCSTEFVAKEVFWWAFIRHNLAS